MRLRWVFVGYLRGLCKWIFIMVIDWYSNRCKYFGHSGVGLYRMVLGGMVVIMCISAWQQGGCSLYD